MSSRVPPADHRGAASTAQHGSAVQVMITRVANGWLVAPGSGPVDGSARIAVTAEELAQHVRRWAAQQSPAA